LQNLFACDQHQVRLDKASAVGENLRIVNRGSEEGLAWA